MAMLHFQFFTSASQKKITCIVWGEGRPPHLQITKPIFFFFQPSSIPSKSLFFLPFNHTQAKENIQSSSKRNACYGRAPSKEESRSMYTVWKPNYYWDQIISDIIISDLLFWRDEQTQLERHSFLNVPTQQNYQLWFWFFFFNMYRKLFQDFTNKFFDSNLLILNRTTLLETFIFKCFFGDIFSHQKNHENIKIKKFFRCVLHFEPPFFSKSFWERRLDEG